MKSELKEVELSSIWTGDTNSLFRSPEEFTEPALRDLIMSIGADGVIQPVLLRRLKGPKGEEFQLVAGERRFRASGFTKLKMIPAYIRELTDEQVLNMQIVENNQRENINPMNQALGFQWIILNKHVTAASIAQKIGRSADYVQERLRLTTLIPDIQALIRTGEIPLKAGLKFAMIPEKQQLDAMNACTTRMQLADKHGEKSRTVFEGLDELQTWMDENLWTNLINADFDREDPKLNPEMGACGSCRFRTKNTGGLFDDITSEDKCLKSACFRTKQAAHYKKQQEQLQKKYPGKTIVFKERGHSAGEPLKKLLGEIKSSAGGEAITEKEMLADKKGEVAIMVGHSRYGSPVDLKKKIMFTRPRTTESSGGSSSVKETPKTPEQKKKADQAAKDQKLREDKQSVTETVLTAETIIKHAAKMREYFLRVIILSLADMGECEDFRAIFMAMGIDWYEDFNGKKTLVKAKEADLAVMHGYDSKWDIDEDHINEVIKKLKLDQLLAVAGAAQYFGDYNSTREMSDFMKIDTKAIKTKAISLTSGWWTELKAKRAQEEEYRKNPDLKRVDDFLALPIGKKPAKKGLSGLVKKGSKK